MIGGIFLPHPVYFTIIKLSKIVSFLSDFHILALKEDRKHPV